MLSNDAELHDSACCNVKEVSRNHAIRQSSRTVNHSLLFAFWMQNMNVKRIATIAFSKCCTILECMPGSSVLYHSLYARLATLAGFFFAVRSLGTI
jgi:hypothetical protein